MKRSIKVNKTIDVVVTMTPRQLAAIYNMSHNENMTFTRSLVRFYMVRAKNVPSERVLYAKELLVRDDALIVVPVDPELPPFRIMPK